MLKPLANCCDNCPCSVPPESGCCCGEVCQCGPGCGCPPECRCPGN